MPDSPEPLTPPLNIFSREDFEHAGLNEFLAVHQSADEYELGAALYAAAAGAAEAGDGARERVFKLVMDLLSCHLRVDGGAPFGPRRTDTDNRTLIPSDIVGVQTDVLAEIAPTVSHPLLRARLCDVAVTNSRKHHLAGKHAILAYCEVAIGRMEGNIARRVGGLELGYTDIIGPIRRAVSLMKSLRVKEIPPELTEAFRRAWVTAIAEELYVPFVELAESGLAGGLVDIATVAAAADALAASAGAQAYPSAVKHVWVMAAQCYSRLEQADDLERCAIASAELTLRMRDQCDRSAAKASWTADAILEFRQIKSQRARVKELQVELRHLQAAAPDELHTFSTPIDLESEREHAVEVFQRLPLAKAMAQLVVLTKPPKLEELRQRIRDQRSQGSVMDVLFGSKVEIDAEGKVIARVTAPGMESEPTEARMKEGCIRHMEIDRMRRVFGFIEPARQTLMERFSIEERHVGPIIKFAEFVPGGHEDLFCRGFALMFQGDYAAAAHLLFPQLENSLRHLLRMRNIDTPKMDDDAIQGDRSLNMLLTTFRSELAAMWGEDTIHDIDILFNHRPGPALRNELAHGKLTTGRFYGADAIYGCWFIFRMVFFTAFHHWKDIIAPAIENEL